jgi:hypothetical protein
MWRRQMRSSARDPTKIRKQLLQLAIVQQHVQGSRTILYYAIQASNDSNELIT